MRVVRAAFFIIGLSVKCLKEKVISPRVITPSKKRSNTTVPKASPAGAIFFFLR